MDHSFDLTIAPSTVHADLITEDFLRAFATEVGVEVDSLTCDASGERAVATMEWRFSTSKPGIPDLAQKLLPGEVRLSWAQEWGSLGEAGAEVFCAAVLEATGALLLPSTVYGYGDSHFRLGLGRDDFAAGLASSRCPQGLVSVFDSVKLTGNPRSASSIAGAMTVARSRRP